jgi:subtilisin-like proprotein convertase family protein
MLDARVNLQDSYRHATAARPGKAVAGLQRAGQQIASITTAKNQKKAAMPGLDVRLSNFTAGPELVHNAYGSLTAASTQRSEDIVRGFLNQNGALYGLSASDVNDLVVLGDSPGGRSGLRMLRMEQRIDGRPVFQSETRFIIDRSGRLISSSGRLVPSARVITPLEINPISPVQAIIKLMAFEGKSVDPSALSIPPLNSNGWIQIEETDDYLAGTISARQVLFPIGPGQLVPAWAVVAFTTGDADWYAIVDAETGDLLWRKNIRASVSVHDARFRVFVQADGVTPADSPAPNSPSTALPGGGTQFPFLPQTIVGMHTAMAAADPSGLASPNGWIDDCPGGVCTANQTQTLGNNTLTCMDSNQGAGGSDANICDTNAAFVIDGNGRPTGNPDANARNRDFLGNAPRDFQTGFIPPPQTTSADAEVGQTATGNGSNGTNVFDSFRRGMVTHLFYMTNWYHDRLFTFGFDEASGNFQNTNFTANGLGNDRVLGDAQDGSGTNNANFSTPPDGVSGRMQMYRFTGPTKDRDGGLDAEIALHEMTHGTSNRLVGDGAGLNWDPAGGMGEGWSDFYALSLLNNTNADNPNGRYASGAYATYKLSGFPTYLDNYVYGIRRFPYSTDNSVNPMTWADVDDVTNNLSGGIPPDTGSGGAPFNNNGGMEVHNIGEIWALTLWEVRSRVIADPAGANGDVPTGNTTMLQLVTDGLKMTPIDPNFTDARNALFDADCATNACANENSIWSGFADRGLGYGASTPYNILVQFGSSHMGVHESFSVPFLNVVNASTDVTVDDSAANNNGAIDPGEAVGLTVKLTNPWRAASKNVTSATGTLTTSTPGVTIYDNTAAWGAIGANSTVAASDAFTFTVAASVACGTSIDFTLTTTSNLGTTATNFSVRVGKANGTDPVVTYTRTPSPALAITDGSSRGVFDQMTITDDFQIADLNFRLDSVTHTFDGDLTFLLRSPAGIGSDIVGLIAAATDPGGFGSTGDNITNMVIDDDLPVTAANDMVEATSAQAPYTASWLPEFNGPWPPLFGFDGPDPVGSLQRYDGTSTKGIWTVLAADYSTPDAGALNSWSILVTPTHFDCVAFAPAAALTATKTVAGSFQVNGTVTYTVTITNNGTANQADNAGNEFTDVLPASLTLVNATGTSGTTGFASNTVTWNGSLAPLGGSVTITITATVKPGTQGTTISNQGTLSYDGNNDNVNDTSGVTDDPSVAGTTNPTSFTVAACTTGLVITPVPAQVCANSTGNTASGPAGAGTYSWGITNGTITSATNIQTITYTAGASGTVTLTLTTTDGSGCHNGTANVTINPNPDATITAPASVVTGSTGNVASVANAGVGATYAWSVTGGTLTGGNNTPSITFTAGAPGTLTLNVTVTTGSGCSDTKSKNVTVVVPPVTVTSVSPTGGTIAGGSAVTINGTGFNAGAAVTFGGSAATNVVVVSSIKITARTPAHAAGSVNVTVTNTDTSSGTLTNGYLYKPQQFDPNNDGTITAMDIFYLVNYLYMGGPAPAGAAGVLSGDANGDGVVNPLDIFYVVNYLFLGGPRPNSIPSMPVTAMAIGTKAPELNGSIALGKPILRGGRYFVPVIMTAGRGSIAPQAMSLRVHFDGEVGNATITKAGAAKNLAVAFETDRFAGNDLSYLVSYGNLFLGTTASAVVAEIEVESSDVTISIDPQLTVLSNQAGTMTASVSNGKLKVTGTKIGNGSLPQPRTPEHKVN